MWERGQTCVCTSCCLYFCPVPEYKNEN
uniref:Uncharacterized protein n=1 Tax=Anguilla anguilla TaxID=7936 RepID=A0A0E9SUW4_ANGAN